MRRNGPIGMMHALGRFGRAFMLGQIGIHIIFNTFNIRHPPLEGSACGLVYSRIAEIVPEGQQKTMPVGFCSVFVDL